MIVSNSGAAASEKDEIVNGFAMINQLEQSRVLVAVSAMDNPIEVCNAIKQIEYEPRLGVLLHRRLVIDRAVEFVWSLLLAVRCSTSTCVGIGAYYECDRVQ